MQTIFKVSFRRLRFPNIYMIKKATSFTLIWTPLILIWGPLSLVKEPFLMQNSKINDLKKERPKFLYKKIEGVRIKVKLDWIKSEGVRIKVKGVRIKSQLDCNFLFSQLDPDQSETCRYTKSNLWIIKLEPTLLIYIHIYRDRLWKFWYEPLDPAFGRSHPVLLRIFGPFGKISFGYSCKPIISSKKYKKFLFQIIKKVIFWTFLKKKY